MPDIRFIYCIMLLAFVPCALHAGQPSAESMRRAAERQARTSALKSIPETRRKALSPAADALAATAAWLIGLNAKPETEKVIAELAATDEQHAKLEGLKKSTAEIAAPAALDDAKQKEILTKLKAAQKLRGAALADFARNLNNVGLYGNAFDALTQALEADPDNAAARQALGHMKTPTVWSDAFSAAQMQKGLTYVAELGWVPTPAAERTGKGEWFDNNRWMPMADADKLHAENANAWVIETAHFTIKSTAPRKEAIQIAEQLESLRKVCYREFIDFFVRGSDKRGQMFFAHAAPKKMLVNYYGARGDYEAVIRKEFKGPIQMLLMQLPGAYFPQSKTSYFSLRDQPPIYIYFMYNQVIKQVLFEYAQFTATEPRPWATEGLCQVAQFSKLEGNTFTPLHGKSHPCFSNANTLAQGNGLPSLATLLTLPRELFEGELRELHANASGGLALFLLEGKDRAMAKDFLEYVYDSFKQKTAVLGDYTGLEGPGLEKEFLLFLAGAKP